MTQQQHQMQDELPRIASRHHYQNRGYDKDDKSFDWMKALWPVASWYSVVFNGVICGKAAYDMWVNGYVWYYHYSLMFAFCLNLAILAYINNRYINPKEDE